MPCGLTAKTTAPGAIPAGSSAASAMIVTPGLPRNAAVAALVGSIMVTGAALPAVPRPSHPLSSAPPILPQPTSNTGAPGALITAFRRLERRGLRLAGRIQAGARHGLGGILTAPHDVLKCRIEAFAFVEG